MIAAVTPTSRSLLALIALASCLACGPAEEPEVADACARIRVRPTSLAEPPYQVSVALDGVAGWFDCPASGSSSPRAISGVVLDNCGADGFDLTVPQAGELTIRLVYGPYWFASRTRIEELNGELDELGGRCLADEVLDLPVDNVALSTDCVTPESRSAPPCGYGTGEPVCGSDGRSYAGRCELHREASPGTCRVAFPSSYCDGADQEVEAP